MPDVDRDLAAELAPSGVLRAGINLSNFLLVTGRDDAGRPVGVAPDMARAVGERIGVGVEYVTYPNPGALADAAGADAWDVALIGAEPARAKLVQFTTAYCEIQSTYLVPANSRLDSIEAVDQPGVRIACAARTAYGLWLERNIRHAELVQTDAGLDASFDMFVRDGLDALAGLRPKLLSEVGRLEGARILPGHFASVQQAIGTKRERSRASAFLQAFVTEAIGSGLVAGFIAAHGVEGLSVARPG